MCFLLRDGLGEVFYGRLDLALGRRSCFLCNKWLRDHTCLVAVFDRGANQFLSGAAHLFDAEALTHSNVRIWIPQQRNFASILVRRRGHQCLANADRVDGSLNRPQHNGVDDLVSIDQIRGQGREDDPGRRWGRARSRRGDG